MHATPQQRVTARAKILENQGWLADAALTEAYRLEGVTPPQPAAPAEVVGDRDFEAEIEDLHWQHSCEMRRADACAARARRTWQRERLTLGALDRAVTELRRVGEGDVAAAILADLQRALGS